MTTSISVISSTSNVRDWLAGTRHPRILHIFERACNLIDEHGDVLSIVTPPIGNGPFNLVVGGQVCFSDHLSLECPISIFSDHIDLGALTINTTAAKFWNPRPDWDRLHRRKAGILDQLTQLQLTNYLNDGDIDTRLGEHAVLPNHQGLPITITQSLLSSVSTSDLSSALVDAQKLAGLGIGLTPSGDDFIMGALHAAWIIHPPEVASVLAREIANTAAPLTTSLSAAWLRAAGRGEAGMVWHEFFDALRSSDSLRIQKTLKSILAVGETSGADALAGFIGVFRSWMGEAGSKHG